MDLSLCVLEHRPLLLQLLYDLAIWKRRKRQEVEITKTLKAEKDQQSQLSLAEVLAAEGAFRQPTAAEISILTFSKLRDSRRHAQELSNEFARLLNRGSSLE